MKNISTFTPDKIHTLYALLMLGALTAGIAAGSVWQIRSGTSSSPWIHQYFFRLADNTAMITLFLRTFASCALFLAAAFLTGLFTFGQPLGAALLIYRGFGIGSSVAIMYSMLGMRAVIPVLLLVLPKVLVICMISVLAVRELFRASRSMLRFWLYADVPDDNRRTFRLYCIKFIVLLFFSLILSVADALLSTMYIRM